MSTDLSPMPSPSLTHVEHDRPCGVVLMLHGGAERTTSPVDGRSLSWQRSRRMMQSIAGPATSAGLELTLLRYRVKGWNHDLGPTPAPVPDARWAIEQVRAARPGVPIVLLGHSMGARAAVAVADDPAVAGVVALAPWFPPGEPVEAMAGLPLRVGHGRADRITSPRASREYVERARRAGSDATWTDMGRVGHYMFRAAARWNAFAVEQSVALVDAAV